MCIPINISNDGVVEETESFAVTLVTEDPAALIMLPFAGVTIFDSSGMHLDVCLTFMNHALIQTLKLQWKWSENGLSYTLVYRQESMYFH